MAAFLSCALLTVLLARCKNKAATAHCVAGERRGRSALGPYRIGNLGPGGQEQSRQVRRNRRSQYLPAHDLGRLTSVEAASNPTSSAGRFAVAYRAGGRDQGVSGLGWSSPSTQMSARSL